MKTVVGVFPNINDAHQTANELAQLGIGPSCVDVLTESDVRDDDELIDELKRHGVAERDAKRYMSDLHRGCALEAVRVDDDRVPAAVDVMRRHTYAGKQPGAGMLGEERELTEAQPGSLSVIQEELVIGKRTVETGAIRAKTKVSEKPVEEEVSLKREAVKVERRPTDQPVAEGTIPFEEKTIEMIETAEEPIVGKRARIVEEVALGKETQEHKERIRETVRRQDVEIERVPFDKERYREHFAQQYGASGEQLETYTPAYQFGHELRGEEQYRGRDWSDIEPSAKRDWEQKNPGTWERFKQAIAHAWESAKK